MINNAIPLRARNKPHTTRQIWYTFLAFMLTVKTWNGESLFLRHEIVSRSAQKYLWQRVQIRVQLATTCTLPRWFERYLMRFYNKCTFSSFKTLYDESLVLQYEIVLIHPCTDLTIIPRKKWHTEISFNVLYTKTSITRVFWWSSCGPRQLKPLSFYIVSAYVSVRLSKNCPHQEETLDLIRTV